MRRVVVAQASAMQKEEFMADGDGSEREFDPQGLRVCGRCFGLFEPGPGSRRETPQTCWCRSSEEPRWEGFDFNEWATLCSCCSRTVLPAGSRWSTCFCDPCSRRVRILHAIAGESLLPIGAHTAANGINLEEFDEPGVGRFLRQVEQMSRAIDTLEEWKRLRTARVFDLCVVDDGSGVELAEYLHAAARSDHPDLRRPEAFRGMCEAFGIARYADEVEARVLAEDREARLSAINALPPGASRPRVIGITDERGSAVVSIDGAEVFRGELETLLGGGPDTYPWLVLEGGDVIDVDLWSPTAEIVGLFQPSERLALELEEEGAYDDVYYDDFRPSRCDLTVAGRSWGWMCMAWRGQREPTRVALLPEAFGDRAAKVLEFVDSSEAGTGYSGGVAVYWMDGVFVGVTSLDDPWPYRIDLHYGIRDPGARSEDLVVDYLFMGDGCVACGGTQDLEHVSVEVNEPLAPDTADRLRSMWEASFYCSEHLPPRD